jgi:NADH-quinone oxidoreductase subunit J
MSSLAAGMIFISAFFFLLNADFLGVVQIVVYTGAIMAIYAFGMMFFDSISDVKEKYHNPKLIFGLTGGVAIITVIIMMAPTIGNNILAYEPVHSAYGNAQDVGLVLFTKYLVPFEVAAVMLLVAMISGIILAGKKMDISITELHDEEIDHIHSSAENHKEIKWQ